MLAMAGRSVLQLALLTALITPTEALEVASNSPCLDKCNTDAAGTTEADIVCLDSEFTDTTNGSHFQSCVECELGSTAVDPSTGTSDMLWGLYNLRFTLSTCMFGYPVQKVSTSSPCQVTCAPLYFAVESGLDNNTHPISTDLSFCKEANFTENVISECVFCYGLMDDQKYLANFLQALNIACQDPPSPTNPFPVAGSAIFNDSAIAAPTTSSTSSSHHKLTGTPLVLAIVLPIVAAIILLTITCLGCFFLTRRRRREMAQRGKMRRVHERWAESPVTPRTSQPFDWDQAALDMQEMQGAHPTERYSGYNPDQNYYNPQYEYRDDVGPGPGQKQDHELHNQYFPPSPHVDEFAVGDDGDEGVEHVHPGYGETHQLPPPNLIDNSPEIGVARGGTPQREHHDPRQDWI